MYIPEPESEYERWRREQKEAAARRKKKRGRKPNQQGWLNDLRHGYTPEGEDFENFERFDK
jgi:hypothetical protein